MADTSREHTRWFTEALAHHQRGDLAQAENIYQRLLAQDAEHSEASSLLGTIRIQQGRFHDGIALLEKVLKKTPQHPIAEANLGLAYHEVGDLPQAIAHYRRAITLDGGSDQAVNNLACALRESGQLDEAQALLNEVVKRDSTFAPAHYNLGLIHKTRGELTAAMACYRQAIQLRPRYADAYFNLGNALRELDDAVAALAAYDAALAVAPEMAQAWDNRGLTLLKLDRLDEALASHQRATTLAPNSPEAQCNLGSLYSHLGRKDESLTCFRRALELNPNYAEVWCNIANTLTQQGKSEEAVTCCDRALAIQPDLFIAHLNRGAALLTWGHNDEAATELAWCAAREPNHPQLLINTGTLAASDGDTIRALDYFRRAIEAAPDNAMAQWNYGLANLANGELERGWIGYEWGLKTSQRVSAVGYKLPRWEGEPIQDKTLLITAEQGVGDELQLASCLPDVLARARRVIVQCDPRLVSLYQRSFPNLIVHGGPRNEPTSWLNNVGGADLVIELGSLPRFVRPRLQEFLNKPSYIQPDPVRVSYWRSRLAQLGPQPKVGIAWRSRFTQNRRLRHYPSVEDLAPLLRTAGVIYINLQYDDCEAELAQLRAQSGADIQQLDGIDLFNNLDDSSALIKALDLVIAPSTTTFVLAGSIGTPCWQLCPCPMEAWLFGRDDHAWFSQARLYRQKIAFEWHEVVQTMAHDLEQWAHRTRVPHDTAEPAPDAKGNVMMPGRKQIPPDAALSDALSYHQRGDFVTAERLYRRLLEQNKHHLDAAVLLGTIHVQQGRNREGITLFEEVLKKNSEHPLAEANLGLAYHQLGELTLAIVHYRKAIALDGGTENAVSNLACALRETNNFKESEQLLGVLVSRGTKYSPVYYNLGLIHRARKQLDSAANCFRRAIELQPDYLAAHYQLGDTLRELGDFTGALAALDAVLTFAPDMFEAWDIRGVVLAQLARKDEALVSHRRAIELAPQVAELHCSLGSLYEQQGRIQDAIESYYRALELKQDFIELWCNIARLLTGQGRQEEAIVCCDRALAVNPQLYLAHVNRGAALLELGRDDEARWELDWCFQRDPHQISVLVNRGTLASVTGDAAQALDCYQKAVTLDPNDAMAQWNYALALLANGDLEQGWSGYDWGFKLPQRARQYQVKISRWQGEDIRHRKLLVLPEQGVGDEIQLASCLYDVAQRAEHVMLQCDPRLTRLYRRSFPQFTVHGGKRDEPLSWVAEEGGADAYIELGSLPRFVRQRLSDFASKSPYLIPDPQRVSYWRERLSRLGAGPKVGFAWRSRLNQKWRSRHYPALNDVLPILRTPGVIFINLQYDECAAELLQLRESSGATIHNFEEVDFFNDFDDSAALIRALDLVIAPSTTTFVLAGAIGTPCWQMCPCAMEAWFFGRKEHVWFPQARIYRQQAMHQWDEVMTNIARDLAAGVLKNEPLGKVTENTRQYITQRVTKHNQAEALHAHQSGNLSSACEMYEPLLTAQPENVELLMLYGTALAQSGKIEQGEVLLQRAAALAPHVAEIWNNLAFVYQLRGHLVEEIAAYRKAVACNAQFVPGWRNLANACLVAGQNEAALDALRVLRELEPTVAEHAYRTGKALQAKNDVTAARQAFDAALLLDPNHPESLNERGYVSYEAGDYTTAEHYFERALQARPGFVMALVNLGSVRKRYGDLISAEDYFRRALACDSACAPAHHNLSLVLLAQGKLEEGWTEWSWRKQVDTGAGFSPVPVTLPLWRGDTLLHQTLLVHGEQGVGDEILFASCINAAAARVGRLILQCDERLAPLFARSFPQVTVFGAARARAAEWPNQFSPVHVHCPSGDLPQYVRRELSAFAHAKGYLRADPVRVEYWRKRFENLGAGRKVGVAWRSHYLEGHREHSYFDLETLAPALQIPGIVWINLQYGDCAAELSAIATQHGCVVHHFPEIDLFNDFDEAAAYMTALDAVVSPEMATYNLAGALGVKTWLLLSSVPKRAWVSLGTDGVPWYPSVIPLQQDESKSFHKVTDRLAEALIIWLANTAPQPESVRVMKKMLGSKSVALTMCAANAAQAVDEQHLTLLDLMHIEQGLPAADILAGAAKTVLGLRPWIVIDGLAVLRDDKLAGVLHALGYRVMSPAALGVHDNVLVGCLICCPIPLWTRENPSPRYRQLLTFYQKMHTQGYDRVVNGATIHTRPDEAFPGNELPLFAQPIELLIRMYGARTLLDFGAGKGKQYELPLTVEDQVYPSVRAYWHGVDICCYEPALGATPLAEDARFDGVVSTDVLEHIAESDVPWVLNELFSRARYFVFASIACFEAMALLPDGSNAHCTVHDPAWWRGVLNVVAARYPQVRFVIAFGLPPGSSEPDDIVWYDSMGPISLKSRTQ